jgi:putative endopeptidase
MAWGTAWRQNTTKERALQMLTLDPHGPNNMRCNQTVANIADFHTAFEVPEDSKMMFIPQDKRVDIW